MFVLGVIAVLWGMAAPGITATLEASRARAAARYLASRASEARAWAVLRGQAVGLAFTAVAGETALSLVTDGNGNGLSAAEVDTGIDPVVEGPTPFGALFPGVSFDPDAGIALGGRGILVFTPEGTASGGSLLLGGADGSRFAVRVLGVTGRVRVERWDARAGAWVALE